MRVKQLLLDLAERFGVSALVPPVPSSLRCTHASNFPESGLLADPISRPNERFVRCVRIGTRYTSLYLLSKLIERLQTALLSPLEFRVEDFQRQFTHTATNTLVPVVHKKVDILAREMVVARIKCGG
jgi:hypothetical protein